MNEHLKPAPLALRVAGVSVTGSCALAGIVTLKSGSVDPLASENDSDEGDRLQEACAKAGKELGAALAKKLK